MIIWNLLSKAIQYITDEDIKIYVYKNSPMNNYTYTNIYTPNITYGI